MLVASFLFSWDVVFGFVCASGELNNNRMCAALGTIKASIRYNTTVTQTRKWNEFTETRKTQHVYTDRMNKAYLIWFDLICDMSDRFGQ